MAVIDEIYVRDADNNRLPIDSYDNTTIDEIVIDGESYHFAKENSVTGTNTVTCDNAVEEPLIKCVIEGNSLQDGTPTPDAPIEVQSVGEKSVNLFNPHVDDELTPFYRIGFEKTFNDDSSFNLSATSLRQNYCYMGGQGTHAKNQECFIPQGESVTTFGTWDCIDSTACIGVCFYDNDKALVRQFNALQNGVVGKWTTTKDIYYISYVIRLPNQVAGNALDINNIKLQLELGSTATQYEPYGKYKIPVVQKGINLWDRENYLVSNAQTGSLRTVFYSSDYDWIKAGEIISISATLFISENDTRTNMRLSCETTNSNGTIYNQQNGWFGGVKGEEVRVTLKYTIPEVEEGIHAITIRLIDFSQNPEKIFDGYAKDIQIELGDTATEFEPYIEPVTTNIFLDEPLRKLGDYADYIDFKGNKVVRKCVKKYLKDYTWGINSETFETDSGIHYEFTARDDAIIPRLNNGIARWDTTIAKSNILPIYATYEHEKIHFGLILWDWYLNIRVEMPEEYVTENTPQAIKTWFTENNAYMVRVLAEPTEEAVNIELPQLPAKTTIIEIDTSLAPSNTNVDYWRQVIPNE